jgi:hypothetical protein
LKHHISCFIQELNLMISLLCWDPSEPKSPIALRKPIKGQRAE